jgi:hypothetical protein
LFSRKIVAVFFVKKNRSFNSGEYWESYHWSFREERISTKQSSLDEKEKGQIGGGYIPFWQVLAIFFMGNGQHKFYANKSKKIESPHYLW